MGNVQPQKFSDHGSIIAGTQGVFKIPVPECPPHVAKGASFAFQANCGGQLITATAPAKSKPGQQISISVTTPSDIVCSTLPTPPPGYTIRQQKPIIFGNTSVAYTRRGIDIQSSMSAQVSPLLQEAQSQLIQEAKIQGCNAVLGITFSITNDSSGEYGEVKLVLVTVFGTPCVVESVQILQGLQTTPAMLPMASEIPPEY